MSDETQATGGPITHESGPTHRSVEIGLAIFTAVLSLIAMAGSLQVGIGWGFDGPAAGFFPFYCAVAMLIASGINLFQAKGMRVDTLFAEWGQIRQVLSVLIPASIYVVIVPWLGIYLSSLLLIMVFMKWIGNYGWSMVLGVSIPTILLTFITFERWFLVPLPKGPVEAMLGF